MSNQSGARTALITTTAPPVTVTDQRVRVFRLRVLNCRDFDHYTTLYCRAGRNQFEHDIYFNPDTEEKLFDAVRAGKVPLDKVSVGEVIGWLIERGIESLG